MITPANLPPKYRDLFYACTDAYNMMNIGLSNLSPWIIWVILLGTPSVIGMRLEVYYPAKIPKRRNPDYWLSES